MTNIPLERSIQKQIRLRLKALGSWIIVNAPHGFGYNPGRLDITGIYRGLGFCLEVKRPGRGHIFDAASVCPHCWKECTQVQRLEIAAVRAAGGLAHVVTSAVEAQMAVEYWYKLRMR